MEDLIEEKKKECLKKRQWQKRGVIDTAMFGTLAGILVSKRLKPVVFLERVVLGMMGKCLMLYKV